MKPIIIHVITSLARGGAEVLLVGVINAMPQYEHRIISLQSKNDFQQELKGMQITCLNLKGYRSLPRLIREVKEILAPLEGKAIVHAHLFWANIISRYAAPKGMPVFNSYHGVTYGREGANYPPHAVLLDRLSYRKDIQTICVSEAVRKNIADHIRIRDNVQILHNFIEDDFFQEKESLYQPATTLRLVSVGNLKVDKNYDLTLDALKIAQQNNDKVICTLDVYGSGPLEQNLKNKAKRLGLENVKFCGAVRDVAQKLRHYDAYLISSGNEGFGLAVVEAMASGLPVLASDLPVLREVTNNKALFFDSQNPAALAAQLNNIYTGEIDISLLSQQGQKQALHFRKSAYVAQLDAHYQTALRAMKIS